MGTYFWTTVKERDYCGDPVCSGGFDVVDNNPSKNRLSYIGVWEKMVEILEPRGYKPIKRYPVVARWNPTVEFTIASIAAFQPYVITGEAEPPAKKLIIPQMSLRFNDIENVGITGSHFALFCHDWAACICHSLKNGINRNIFEILWIFWLME